MTRRELTDRASLATSLLMQGQRKRLSDRGRSRAAMAAMLVTGAMTLGGCVSVNAPDKPIVIELNINIKQDVVYRLADDAKQTLDKNAGIF